MTAMTARPRVKICGLTRAEDAELAVALGADAIGFVFWPKSPRHIERADARAIASRLGAFVTRVGVFVDASPDDVSATVRDVGLDVVQLHGDENVADYAGVPARLVKAVALGDEKSVETAIQLPPAVMPLADAFDAVRRGGTGQLAHWPHAARVALRRPLVLAGGLRPENIRDAIRTVRPWGVDVSSGVEDAPGLKSPERLRQLFAAVAAATEVL